MIRRKGDHVCGPECFPTRAVTFFCFACSEEIFKPQVAKHGRRWNQETQSWETWYVCRDCRKKFQAEVDANRGPKREGWILTSSGWVMQGRYGTPTDNTLKVRRKRGYD